MDIGVARPQKAEPEPLGQPNTGTSGSATIDHDR